jgi:hypothetical protein
LKELTFLSRLFLVEECAKNTGFTGYRQSPPFSYAEIEEVLLMRLSAKAMTIASAILWGAAMFIVGIVNLIAPSHGAEFLRLISSVYPGFHDSRTFLGVIAGAMCGIVGGAIAGFLFGSIYDMVVEWANRMTKPST